jgi:hypothetical protein
MTEAPYPTGNILSCVAFSKGEGPRSVIELFPLVSFMSGVDSTILMARLDEFLMWVVVCGWELQQQFAELLQEVEWPDWNANDDVLMQWYESEMTLLGKNLMVQPLPFENSLDQLDYDSWRMLRDTLPAIQARLNS